jgi:hypothetical protein
MAVFRVSVYGLYVGQMTCNVIHFNKPDAVQIDMHLLANWVNSNWVHNPFALNVSGFQSWNRIHVAVLDASWPAIDLTIADAGIDGISQDFTPMVSAVFQLHTDTGGRRGRGRHYVGGFGHYAMNNGFWSPAAQVRLDACAAALEFFWKTPGGTVLAASGFAMGVCPRNDPSGFKPVTHGTARGLVGVQRRRQIGVGA